MENWDGLDRREECRRCGDEENVNLICSRNGPCTEAVAAADHAVDKVFAILGVDVHNPKDLKEFQKFLMFSQSASTAVDRGIKTVIAIVLISAGTWCWGYVKHFFIK